MTRRHKERGLFALILLLLSSHAFVSAADDPARLAGDGVTDDAPAIQAMLDSGAALVYLPPPEKCYLLCKTLKIHSNQTLRLDPTTTIRLADEGLQHLISNSDYQNGNANITIEGGIWDGNNLTQTCRYHTPGYVSKHETYNPEEYNGVLMQFKNVQNLTVQNLTLKDPETFAVQLGEIRSFCVENIRFDYNLAKRNMDGIHLNGGCRQGRIVNLRGNTNDDMVALNANDGAMYELAAGEIADILVDGLWADNGYTAVRILSAGDPVRRVHITNIFGSWRYHVVSFTHHNVHQGERLIEDVTIDHIFSAKQQEEVSRLPESQFDDRARHGNPLFYFEAGCNIRNVTIENLVRREFLPNPPATVRIGAGTIIDHFTLRNVTQINCTKTPSTLINNEGTIEQLTLENVVLKGEEGFVPQQITGSGTVGVTE
ncbi:MAG: glycosyl hydrolase family 28 protein [Planctomycetia bacterium]|nr:glycosyl hydrolase family 28 protein [Planctomycetia bacterium]